MSTSAPLVSGRVPVRSGAFNVLAKEGQIVHAAPDPEFLQRFASGPFAVLRRRFHEVAAGIGGATGDPATAEEGGGGAKPVDPAAAPLQEPVVLVMVQTENDVAANPGGYTFFALARSRADYVDAMEKTQMTWLDLEGTGADKKGANFVASIKAAPPTTSHAVFEFRLGTRAPVYLTFPIA